MYRQFSQKSARAASLQRTGHEKSKNGAKLILCIYRSGLGNGPDRHHEVDISLALATIFFIDLLMFYFYFSSSPVLWILIVFLFLRELHSQMVPRTRLLTPCRSRVATLIEPPKNASPRAFGRPSTRTQPTRHLPHLSTAQEPSASTPLAES